MNIRGEDVAASLGAILQQQVRRKEIVLELCVRARALKWIYNRNIHARMHAKSKVSEYRSADQLCEVVDEFTNASMQLFACVCDNAREPESILVLILTALSNLLEQIHALFVFFCFCQL